jgi:RNA polymerase sigma-70 factor (ECF subfamily)
MSRDLILVKIRERILAYAASRQGRDAAEDLAQDVIMVLEQKYGHVQALEELVPLSFQILRFKMTSERRKSVRRGENTAVPVDDLPLASDDPDPAEQAERQQRLDRLAQAMQRLGERCRQILRWKLEGKSFPEIRTLLGVESLNTLYTWDLRCRKELLERLGGSWDAQPSRKEVVQ